MTKLRCGICCMALMVLLLVTCCPTCLAAVGMCVSTEGTGPGSNARAAYQGCAVKFIVYAYDCDEHDCTCCDDNLTFPDWPLPSGTPAKVGGAYYGEFLVTCDWFGPKEFVFKADDQVICPEPYGVDDEPAVYRVTVIGLELLGLTGPTGPFCPGETATYYADTTAEWGYGAPLTWQGGDPLPEQFGGQWRTQWNTPGDHTVTVSACGVTFSKSARVYEPVYEVTMLEPVGFVGGAVPVRVQVKTRCAWLLTSPPDYERNVAIEREDPASPTGWTYVSYCTEELGSRVTEDGVITEVFKGHCNTLDLKDGSYRLRAKVIFQVYPGPHQAEVIAYGNVTVKNLSFTSSTKPSVIAWDGETAGSVTVTLEDNDLSDPMTLVMTLWPTNMNNSGSVMPEATANITLTNVAGSTHTFTWNGLTRNWDGTMVLAAPGLYTYNVVAWQTDICNTDPTVYTTDTAWLRSEHMRVKRATDDVGNPIYDAYLDGYDDNGTPDELDDNYLYVIRKYSLTSTDDITASEGWVSLYDPTLTPVGVPWNIADLECVQPEHTEGDGLDVGYHAIRIPVPVSSMQHDGTYRFVLQMKDAHGDRYRNGQDRWALELNAVKTVTALVIVDGDESYLPEVGNSTTVTAKVVNAENPSELLTKALVPITVQATPSHLVSTCSNYKEQDAEKYDFAGTSKPKADLVWKEITSGGTTTQIEPDRTKYNNAVDRTIYSSLDTKKPSGAPTYQGGQLTMKFDSFDHGGRVKVAVSIPDSPKWCHVAVQYKDDPEPKDMTYMWVPWDLDGDRLPDKWEKDLTDPDSLTRYAFGVDDDDDPHTASSNTGDGLYAFEEYRGFQCKGTWSRLDPKEKDLFIRSPVGIGDVPDATRFAVHEVQDGNDDEMTEGNVVTANCYESPNDEFSGLQRRQKGICIVLTDVALPEEPTAPAWAGWGSPNDINGIGHSNCVHIHNGNTLAVANQLGVTVDVVRTHIITHEVAHSLKLTPTMNSTPGVGHHHDPGATDCAMDPHISATTYTHNTYCTGCWSSLTLH